MTRLLTIMGSGETAPTMVKTHRSVFDRLDASDEGFSSTDIGAVFVDTPFGFQENVAELSAKTVEYFRVSLDRKVAVAGLRRVETADALEREAAYDRIRSARLVFAGPGSPTYALRQFALTPIPDLLVEKLKTGGAVTFSSAAALTLGRSTVPVYEIYKSGDDPYWLDGLDVLSSIELPVAVIPHYNNAEGGNHDTRFCYLGERRLAIMETLLPDGHFILGVDEHTGITLDLDAETATVVGLGVVTLRRKGVSVEFPAGTTVSIDQLRAGPGSPASSLKMDSGDRPMTAMATTGTREAQLGLAETADRLAIIFDESLAARDANAAVIAMLDLDDSIAGWSGDTLQSDESDRARALLRSMIVRLGEAAVKGLTDVRSTVAPLVDVALQARSAARGAKLYELSDQIREALGSAGIEVRDTADGQLWDILDRAD